MEPIGRTSTSAGQVRRRIQRKLPIRFTCGSRERSTSLRSPRPVRRTITNMFWDKFFRKQRSRVQGSLPSPDWYERLADLFRRKRGKEFTFELLYQKVNPPSVEALTAALTKLTEEGLVHQTGRVES